MPTCNFSIKFSKKYSSLDSKSGFLLNLAFRPLQKNKKCYFYWKCRKDSEKFSSYVKTYKYIWRIFDLSHDLSHLSMTWLFDVDVWRASDFFDLTASLGLCVDVFLQRQIFLLTFRSLSICFTFVKTPLHIKVVQYVSWKHEIVETITSLLIKTLANLEKEVEERRFYHYANNTDTNVVITRSRRIFLVYWHCRAWMMWEVR